MTDPRVDAALRAAWAYTYPAKEGCSLEAYREHNPEVVANMMGAVFAALAAADAAAWRPMTSTPKDGSRILILKTTGFVCAGHFKDGDWQGDDEYCIHDEAFITHWQPLPKPPTP